MSASAQRALDYLQEKPGTTFSKLYQQPSTALAIFRRMLPHLAKTLVMAMLYMPAPFARDDLDSWFKPGPANDRAKERALLILQQLRIVAEKPDPATGKWFCELDAAFKKSLKAALTGGGNHSSFGVPCSTPDKNPVTVEYLDTYARKQWEAILYYVVGSANPNLDGRVEISAGTKQILEKGRFVKVQGKHRQINAKGFTFLLQEVNAQIWSLMIEYLELSAGLGMDEVDVLSFLFTLGSLELGISYETSNLTPTQKIMLDDLTDYGLIYRRPDSNRYYPTRLATTLTSDAPALPNSTLLQTTSSSDSTAASKGYLILETNFHLYAYTSSPLLISILSLFATLQTRYPNLTTARISKSSIQNAISLGISSAQIISYLQTHAHPIMLRNYPVLPPTASDQIRLWEIEGERMRSFPGFYIKDMEPGDYEKAVQYAETLGVLLRSFPEKKSFFVSNMTQMKEWFALQATRKKAQREKEALERAKA